MNDTTTNRVSLKVVTDFNDDADQFDFFVDGHKVEFYDEYGDGGDWFVLGYEFGPTRLIRARNESDAYSVFIDLEPVVPMDEVHEAYGAWDRLRDYMIAKGYDDDQQLRSFCSRWCRYYFQVATHNANQTGAWDNWDLIEGYEYQSNSTDSGIVNVGHYLWMREVKPDAIEIARK